MRKAEEEFGMWDEEIRIPKLKHALSESPGHFL